MLIERKQGGDVRAGGMSHQINSSRIAAEICGVVVRPAHRECSVFDKRWERDLWIQTIIRQHRDESARGQRVGYETVIRFISALPIAAVKENNDWCGGDFSARTINVELLPRQLAIFQIARPRIAPARDRCVEQIKLSAP